MDMSCTMPLSMPFLLSALSFHFKLVQQPPLSSLIMTMPAIGTGEAHIGQPRTRPERQGLPARARARRTDAPEREQALSPQSSPPPRPLHTASPRHRLAPGQAQSSARALSPPPASKVSAGPVADAASSRAIPSPFLCASTPSSIAMKPASSSRPRLPLCGPERHRHERHRAPPQHPLAAINRGLPLSNSSHHSLLLSSLILLTATTQFAP
jgi:hypothetical protein